MLRPGNNNNCENFTRIMNDATLKIIDATLRTDGSVTAALRRRVLAFASGTTEPVPQNGNDQPRIYSRLEAAKLLGDKSLRYIDLLCRRGLLRKFIPKGNCRSIGVCGESLRAFIEGN